MADTWNGYYLISEVPPGWTIDQRQKAHAALDAIGLQVGEAHIITHSRQNNANTAWIQEGVFTPEELERDYIVAAIAEALEVNPIAVEAKIEYTIFVEGGTWDESRQAAEAYVAAYPGEW